MPISVNKKILVVEDDQGYLSLLKHRLKKAGFEVESSENGEEAIIKFQKSPSPIVLTDLAMPKVDGMTLLKLIKNFNPDTEVIILTGQGTIEKAVEAMKTGAFDFLLKPIERDKLENLVERCFKFIELKQNKSPGKSNDKSQFNYEEMKNDYNEMRKKELKKSLEAYSLTNSEFRVFGLILKGKTDQEIAESLNNSYHTIKKHAQNIFRKLDINSRVELIVKFK